MFGTGSVECMDSDSDGETVGAGVEGSEVFGGCVEGGQKSARFKFGDGNLGAGDERSGNNPTATSTRRIGCSANAYQ